MQTFFGVLGGVNVLITMMLVLVVLDACRGEPARYMGKRDSLWADGQASPGERHDGGSVQL